MEAGKIKATTSRLQSLFDAYLADQEGRSRAPKTILEYRRFADMIAAVTSAPPLSRSSSTGPSGAPRFGIGA